MLFQLLFLIRSTHNHHFEHFIIISYYKGKGIQFFPHAGEKGVTVEKYTPAHHMVRMRGWDGGGGWGWGGGVGGQRGGGGGGGEKETN